MSGGRHGLSRAPLYVPSERSFRLSGWVDGLVGVRGICSLGCFVFSPPTINGWIASEKLPDCPQQVDVLRG